MHNPDNGSIDSGPLVREILALLELHPAASGGAAAVVFPEPALDTALAMAGHVPPAEREPMAVGLIASMMKIERMCRASGASADGALLGLGCVVVALIGRARAALLAEPALPARVLGALLGTTHKSAAPRAPAALPQATRAPTRGLRRAM